MLTFIARRILSGVVLVFAISSLTFFLLSTGGESIARSLLGENASPEQINAKLAELGLQRPPIEQYGEWLGNALRGDFGTSWLSNTPVMTSLLDRLPVTLSIAIGAILLTAVLSIVIGVLAAVYRGWIDNFVQFLAIAGFAMPGLWLALLLILWLAISLQLLPATGYIPFSRDAGGWLASITIPVVAIAVGSIAATAQQVRSAMIDTLELDYIRTLKSRGLPLRSVIFKHALRNAAPTGLTVLSLQFINLLGSTVVIEKISALPGIGSMVLSATISGDSPQVLGVVVMMVVVVVVVNLAIDLGNGWLNPKVRMQ